MHQPELSKQSLGTGYVVATGVALSLALLAHAMTAVRASLSALVIVVIGLVPALGLVAANYWLPRSGLEGPQVWTVAEWSGLGIGLLTLLQVGILLTGASTGTPGTALLASSVAMGGFVGILVGTLLELRRSRQRLLRSNELLSRVLRHDLRNRLNVIFGQLAELEATTTGEAAAHTAELRQSVERLLTTAEKARQIEMVLSADRRGPRPVDVVPTIENRLAAVEGATPDATIETDLPDRAPVYGDWLLGSVFDNVFENAVAHSDGELSLYVTVDVDPRRTTVRIVDNCPAIPQAELDVFSARAETPLQHSKGVGLWLVIRTVESYGGEVRFETTPDSGNVVVLTFRTARWPATVRARTDHEKLSGDI